MHKAAFPSTGTDHRDLVQIFFSCHMHFSSHLCFPRSSLRVLTCFRQGLDLKRLRVPPRGSSSSSFSPHPLFSRALLLTRSDSTSHSAMSWGCLSVAGPLPHPLPLSCPPPKYDFWAAQAILGNFCFWKKKIDTHLKCFFSPKIFFYPKFFSHKIFFHPKFFLLKIFFHPNFFFHL